MTMAQGMQGEIHQAASSATLSRQTLASHIRRNKYLLVPSGKQKACNSVRYHSMSSCLKDLKKHNNTTSGLLLPHKSVLAEQCPKHTDKIQMPPNLLTEDSEKAL